MWQQSTYPVMKKNRQEATLMAKIVPFQLLQFKETYPSLKYSTCAASLTGEMLNIRLASS